jgi:hypothetical protein
LKSRRIRGQRVSYQNPGPGGRLHNRIGYDADGEWIGLRRAWLNGLDRQRHFPLTCKAARHLMIYCTRNLQPGQTDMVYTSLP